MALIGFVVIILSQGDIQGEGASCDFQNLLDIDRSEMPSLLC